MKDRKAEERTFHNILRSKTNGQRWTPEMELLIDEDPLWANMKFYAIERRSRKMAIHWLFSNCPGKMVLDYCCGNGDDSLIISQMAVKKVFGIDISETSIVNCKSRANIERALNVEFNVMDAENLQFPDNTFDIVSEYGALHHLKLEKAYCEIARVLQPAGKCICVEALNHNPFIRYYRKKTPYLRTEWEVNHIMRKPQIMLASKFFNSISILGFFHLVTLTAVPFRNTRFFNAILSASEALDNILLKLPYLKWQAWQVIFVLSDPKKNRSRKAHENECKQ